jgi:hypothetical protein
VLTLPDRATPARPDRVLPADVRPLPSVAAYDELLTSSLNREEVGS